ncbi:hypothetical protein AVV44_gp212 [Cronobacter phage S13]|uniref:Uncharacterized protein n=1 Tax=Cronobacter phage LPCS28 TaxID=2924885 RepID=A0AAE9G8J8_9CAUD|nr:hypothetical protein AVV44_gp212 [Cronobacter phage S13]YP_010665809.1 hypothetical protein PQB73_gp215 [Cronobacter phage LPCS28]AIA65026.1 hypothetical protein S13_229 [Cronobacter phage S13]UNY46998.1 hypothetical protein EHEKIMEA_00116 [Cronobacter phage LPCS28]
MSQLFNALVAHIENEGFGDQKMFSIKQAMEMMKSARAMERAAIEKTYILIPKNQEISDATNEITRIIKGRKPDATPSKYVKGSKEEVFGSRPIKNQWTEEAITKENVENAITVLLNRGYKTATVRDIVDVIRQFVPQGFKAGKKLIDYRHMVTKRFLSSQKKLLGKYGSVMKGTTYVFNIA